jgi:hypothetical protein
MVFWATQRGQATLPDLEIGGSACKDLNGLLGNSAGQATLPDLEIGEGVCRELTDRFGRLSGGKPPFPTLRSGVVLAENQLIAWATQRGKPPFLTLRSGKVFAKN